MPFDVRRLLTYIGYFFGAVSVIVLILSFFVYRHTRRFVDSAARAEGTVTKLVESRNRDSGTTFRPVFVFHDSKGAEHEIYSTMGSYPPSYKVGENVAVLYAPEDPDNASLDGFFDLWLVPLIVGVLGAVQMTIALFFIFIGRIIGKPRQPAG
jgi:hypothetical protein